MALQATRQVYRITLSHVDRGLEREEPVNVARHPSETQAHVVLRVLAQCYLWEEGIAFGPGLSTPDTPDLWVHDLTGRLTQWIECRALDSERLKKILSKGARVTLFFDDERRARELQGELDAWKRSPDVTILVVDELLVRTLAAREDRQHKWGVTIVGDHFYVEADGENADGAVTRVR
jgi:uncharacterized protein YaeQ